MHHSNSSHSRNSPTRTLLCVVVTLVLLIINAYQLMSPNSGHASASSPGTSPHADRTYHRSTNQLSDDDAKEARGGAAYTTGKKASDDTSADGSFASVLLHERNDYMKLYYALKDKNDAIEHENDKLKQQLSHQGRQVVEQRTKVEQLRKYLKNEQQLHQQQQQQQQPYPSAVPISAGRHSAPEALRRSSGTSVASPQHHRPWLTIGIPSVPRKHTKSERPLLLQTLLTIEQELNPPGGSPFIMFDGNSGHDSRYNSASALLPTASLVRVVVMNMRPGKNEDFEEAQHYFNASSRKHASATWLEMVDKGPATSPLEHDPITKAALERQWAGDTHERPTPAVAQQSLDVAALLKHVAGRSAYYYFAEDDFFFCNHNTLLALQYMIAKANRYEGSGIAGTPTWTAIRCSFGLNGIIMHNIQLASSSEAISRGGDLAAFQRYLAKYYWRRPPDHLVVEWFAKESKESREYFGSRRRVMAFRYNVVKHMGKHSSLRNDAPWSTPNCFTELIAPQVFPVEAWNPVDCPKDDMWPCDSPYASAATLQWNAAESAHVSKDRIIYVQKRKPE